MNAYAAHLAIRSWFSSQELADMQLPGLPRVKRNVNELAADQAWAIKTDAAGNPLARKRAGRGGGMEYHVSLLPASARAELIKRGLSQDEDGAESRNPHAANDENASPAWAWFDLQSEKSKTEARRRLEIVSRVHEFEQIARMSKSAAVVQASAESGVGASTIWGWIGLTNGLAQHDWLPALAPQRKGGGAIAEIDQEIWQIFKSDYLRAEKPTLSSCYRRVQDLAKAMGIAIPHEKTFARKVEREIPAAVITLKRHGQEALRRSIPAQRRTVANLHALQLVNIDGHKFDVFVEQDGRIFRPIMVAIQDVMSRKMLAYRIGDVESAIQTRLAFADLFRDYGIPKGCLLDNGRAFASKWITGGALTRFRFKIREEDPTGLLPALGVNPHWATPYRGQSKPIERAFRDLCDTVAKHPAMAGAYTGNNPMAKPENYGSKAIPFDEFRAHVAREIAQHNARQGRRTEMANGRSFDAVFAESYATAPIGKATPEQLRIALLAGENRRVRRDTSHLELFGNRYWCPEMSAYAGQLVTVRFDPDNLHQAIHVYDLAGRYLCSPDLLDDSGFLDVQAAKDRAKTEASYRRSVRESAAMEQLLSAQEVAARLPVPDMSVAIPEPSVVRPVRHRGQTAAALKPRSEASQNPIQDEIMDRFSNAVTRLRLVD